MLQSLLLLSDFPHLALLNDWTQQEDIAYPS